MMHGEDEESDAAMQARIEAEERAKYQASVAAQAAQELGADDDDEGLRTVEVEEQRPLEQETAVSLEDDDGSPRAAGGRLLGDEAVPMAEVPGGRTVGVDLKTVARRFALLGVIAFGGPPAHVALMQEQAWRPQVVDDAGFASLFALTQCLPGPSSTQLAIALGVLSGGVYGGLVAFACFSATATTTMALLGSLVHASAGFAASGALRSFLVSAQMGLAAAAVALVAKAALTLSAKLATDRTTIALNVFGASCAVLLPGQSWVLPTVLASAGLASAAEAHWMRHRRGPSLSDSSRDSSGVALAEREAAVDATDIAITPKVAKMLAAGWLGLLALLGAWNATASAPWLIALLEPFYRVGSLVWGGGPVVLPMLLREVVPAFVSNAQFLQGFAFAQAMPGPVFNFSAYLGGVYAGPVGALVAWAGLFLPGLLLIHAALPYWALLRTSDRAADFLRGVNAAASGLVVAAVVLLLESIRSPPQHAIALITFALHHFAGPTLFGPKLNPPLTVLAGAVLGVPLCWAWAGQAAGAAID